MHRSAQQVGIFAGLAIAGALGWYHVGPYRWLADGQLRLMNAYYPFLTWLVLGLVIGLPLGALASTLAIRANLRDGYDELLLRHGWLVTSRAGQLLLVGLGIGIAGVVIGVRAHAVGEMVPLSIAALERGEPPAGTWVVLTDGVPDRSRAIEVDHRSYVPVFATRPVPMVFVQLPAAGASVVDRGLLVADGLPNLARIAFEDAELIADHHYVIEAGGTPRTDAEAARVLAVLGLVLFGAGGTMRIFSRRGTSSP